MRRIVIASHQKMAYGLKSTVEFLTGQNNKNIYDISAYINNVPVENQINDVMKNFDKDDEVIILTDLLGGSVNQKFFQYVSRPHTHIITGINLPLVLTLALEQDSYLSADDIKKIIEESKNQMIYVNEYKTQNDEEDE